MLGAIFVGVWASGGDFSLKLTNASPTPQSSEKAGSPESGAVSVSDQAAGEVVIIESVTVPPPGVWVAVREVFGRDLGNILGAVRVSGPQSNISVPLLRATEPGLSYAVELYRDDGGKTFDLTSDSVYVDFATGASVITYFTTTR